MTFYFFCVLALVDTDILRVCERLGVWKWFDDAWILQGAGGTT